MHFFLISYNSVFLPFAPCFFFRLYCSLTSFLFSEQIYQLFRQICISHSAQLDQKAKKKKNRRNWRRKKRFISRALSLTLPSAPLSLSPAGSTVAKAPEKLLSNYSREEEKKPNRKKRRNEKKMKKKKLPSLSVRAASRRCLSDRRDEDHPSRCNCVPDEPTKISQTLRRPQVIWHPAQKKKKAADKSTKNATKAEGEI